MLAVVLAGAIVTYGGVSLFVAFFVIAPMAHQLFRAAAIPRRLMPAAIALGTTTFTMSALPGTPAIQNAIPMPFFGTTPFAAPGLGFIAAIVMFGFGMWWLGRAERSARAKGEGYGADVPHENAAEDLVVRERATTASTFDPPEAVHGRPSDVGPPIALAALPLVIVVAVNLLMSLFVLPRMDASFLAKAEWGATSLAAVGGVWAVVTALAVAIVVLIAINYRRLPALRDSMDAGANASVLPVLSVASLVGFGSVVAALPAFALVRDWVLGIEGGPLVSLAVATNVLASLTGSASGGLTIALDALGATYLKIAPRAGHRSGPSASRGGDRRRHARQPAAQRRRGDAARGLQLDPSRELSRHRHGVDRRRPACARRGDSSSDHAVGVFSDRHPFHRPSRARDAPHGRRFADGLGSEGVGAQARLCS